MPIYMKYEGIEGPVNGQYQGWIELMSSQLGIQLKNYLSPDGGETPTSFEIVVTKNRDGCTGQLFKESIDGTAKKVKIDFLMPEKVENSVYLSLELENTIITSYSICGDGNSVQNSMETLVLNATKITSSPRLGKISNTAEQVIERMIC
jgi:type VI protein secretion system component Hcp